MTCVVSGGALNSTHSPLTWNGNLGENRACDDVQRLPVMVKRHVIAVGCFVTMVTWSKAVCTSCAAYSVTRVCRRLSQYRKSCQLVLIVGESTTSTVRDCWYYFRWRETVYELTMTLVCWRRRSSTMASASTCSVSFRTDITWPQHPDIDCDDLVSLWSATRLTWVWWSVCWRGLPRRQRCRPNMPFVLEPSFASPLPSSLTWPFDIRRSKPLPL